MGVRVREGMVEVGNGGRGKGGRVMGVRVRVREGMVEVGNGG